MTTYRRPANAAPEQLPLAVLRNGAQLWTAEQVAAVADPMLIIARPRAAREAEIEAELAAYGSAWEAEHARIAAVPVVVREGSTRGRTRGFGFKARYVELSNGTFEATVEDKQGNVLFPCSGKMDEMNSILTATVADWLDNAE